MSVYACADLHGMGNLATQILEYLKPNDVLFFLGDAIDRGPDGVEIMRKFLSDPRIIYIRGNHEELMAEALPALLAEITDINYYSGNKCYIWYSNGGQLTAETFWKHPEWGMPLVKAIKTIPTEQIYHSPLGHDVILEHAGYSPFVFPFRRHDPTWDRDHFYDEWDNGYKKEECPNPEKTYLVHGHTPVQYLKYMYGYRGQENSTREYIEEKRQWHESCSLNTPFDIKPSVIRYCDGHKFDIDMGSVFTEWAVLLDLDTFEEIYFQTRAEKE